MRPVTVAADANRTALPGAPRSALAESDLQAAALDPTPLGHGERADVYALADLPAVAAKIYRRPDPDAAERVAALIARPPLDPQSGAAHAAFAWPSDRLFDAGPPPRFLGYLMPRGRQLRPLDEFARTAAAQARARVARDLAGAFVALHAAGYAVGAWRAEHVTVGERDRLLLLGCDRYQSENPSFADDLLNLGAALVVLLTGGQSYTPQTHAALPAAVRPLARRCFVEGRDDPMWRPAAEEWAAALAALQTEVALGGVTLANAPELSAPPDEVNPVNPGSNNFDIEVDAEPTPPANPTMFGVPLPQEPAPTAAYAPPPVEPAPAYIHPPTLPPTPSRGGMRWLLVIVALALIVNGVLIAHWQGLITLPFGENDPAPVVQGPPADPKPKGPAPKDETPVKPAPQVQPEKKEPQVQPEKKEPQPKPVVKEEPPRAFRGPRDVLAAVQEDLFKAPADERRYRRYLSLAHLHNDPSLKSADLDRHREALTKLAQHLRPGEFTAEPVGADRIVYRLDLRATDWLKSGAWREVLKAYPYGLVQSEAHDKGTAELAREVCELSGCDLPVLRGDWFAASASRGPLLKRLAPGAGEAPAQVAAAAARYRQPLTLEACARELGLPDAAALRAKIEAEPRLQKRGLGPLLEGGTVARDTWASLDEGPCPCQDAALEMGLGAPLRVRR